MEIGGGLKVRKLMKDSGKENERFNPLNAERRGE